MQNILLILAVSAACAALVLSIAVTAMVIAFANTLKKQSASAQEQPKEEPEAETPAESDNTSEGIETSDQVEDTASIISELEQQNKELAERLSLAWANGKEMLIRQGAESFRLWTGIEPDLDIMRKGFENG